MSPEGGSLPPAVCFKTESRPPVFYLNSYGCHLFLSEGIQRSVDTECTNAVTQNELNPESSTSVKAHPCPRVIIAPTYPTISPAAAAKFIQFRPMQRFKIGLAMVASLRSLQSSNLSKSFCDLNVCFAFFLFDLGYPASIMVAFCINHTIKHSPEFISKKIELIQIACH